MSRGRLRRPDECRGANALASRNAAQLCVQADRATTAFSTCQSAPARRHDTALGNDMALDKAEWHYAGNFPQELPKVAGGTHIGMFIAWVILHGLEGEEHREESKQSLDRVRAREMTGRDFLFKECDEKFWESDMNEECTAFALEYYSGEDGYGLYLTHYENALAGELPSLYHVEDTWENYDRLEPLIDAAFESWRAARVVA